MFRKVIPFLLLLLGGAAAARAQQVVAGVGFATRFDNREYSGTAFSGASETLFSARLTPEVGLRWAGKNTLMIAVDLRQDFGDDAKFLTEAKPQLYYEFRTPKVLAAAGVFDRNKLCGDYGEAFFDRSYLFYRNRVAGLLGSYRGRRGFVELALDWEGMQSDISREQFRLLSAGRYDGGGMFYGGYALSLQHYAVTSDPAEDEGVVDHILVNPFGGMRFHALFDFDIRLGYLQSLQRDRIADNGWETPKGGILGLRMGWKGLWLSNELYAGENLMPLFDRYGGALYRGNVFFRTDRSRIYNRTGLGYDRRFFDDTVGVHAVIWFDCHGSGTGTSQQVEVDIRLQKIFSKKKR